MSINLDIVNRTTSIVAKRNSGKSVLLKYLVDQSKNLSHRIRQHFLLEFGRENCIFDSWNEELANTLIEKMTTQNAKKKKEEKRRKKERIVNFG